MSSPLDNALALVNFIFTNIFDVSVIVFTIDAMSKEKENQARAANRIVEMKTGLTGAAELEAETVVEAQQCALHDEKKKGKKKSTVRIETVDELAPQFDDEVQVLNSEEEHLQKFVTKLMKEPSDSESRSTPESQTCTTQTIQNLFHADPALLYFYHKFFPGNMDDAVNSLVSDLIRKSQKQTRPITPLRATSASVHIIPASESTNREQTGQENKKAVVLSELQRILLDANALTSLQTETKRLDNISFVQILSQESKWLVSGASNSNSTGLNANRVNTERGILEVNQQSQYEGSPAGGRGVADAAAATTSESTGAQAQDVKSLKEVSPVQASNHHAPKPDMNETKSQPEPVLQNSSATADANLKSESKAASISSSKPPLGVFTSPGNSLEKDTKQPSTLSSTPTPTIQTKANETKGQQPPPVSTSASNSSGTGADPKLGSVSDACSSHAASAKVNITAKPSTSPLPSLGIGADVKLGSGSGPRPSQAASTGIKISVKPSSSFSPLFSFGVATEAAAQPLNVNPKPSEAKPSPAPVPGATPVYGPQPQAIPSKQCVNETRPQSQPQPQPQPQSAPKSTESSGPYTGMNPKVEYGAGPSSPVKTRSSSESKPLPSPATSAATTGGATAPKPAVFETKVGTGTGTGTGAGTKAPDRVTRATSGCKAEAVKEIYVTSALARERPSKSRLADDGRGKVVAKPVQPRVVPEPEPVVVIKSLPQKKDEKPETSKPAAPGSSSSGTAATSGSAQTQSSSSTVKKEEKKTESRQGETSTSTGAGSRTQHASSSSVSASTSNTYKNAHDSPDELLESLKRLEKAILHRMKKESDKESSSNSKPLPRPEFRETSPPPKPARTNSTSASDRCYYSNPYRDYSGSYSPRDTYSFTGSTVRCSGTTLEGVQCRIRVPVSSSYNLKIPPTLFCNWHGSYFGSDKPKSLDPRFKERGRCSATTHAGTLCKRDAAHYRSRSEYGYCTQHAQIHGWVSRY